MFYKMFYNYDFWSLQESFNMFGVTHTHTHTRHLSLLHYPTYYTCMFFETSAILTYNDILVVSCSLTHLMGRNPAFLFIKSSPSDW